MTAPWSLRRSSRSMRVAGFTTSSEARGGRANACVAVVGPVYDEVMVGGALSWAVCVEGSLHEAKALAEKALASGAELGLQDHPALIEPLRTRGRLSLNVATCAVPRPPLNAR